MDQFAAERYAQYCVFGTYRASATTTDCRSIISLHPATIRIDKNAHCTVRRSRLRVSSFLNFLELQCDLRQPLGTDDVDVSNRLDVPHWGLAEDTAVLAGELAHALVADFVRCGRSINPVHEHALSCCL